MHTRSKWKRPKGSFKWEKEEKNNNINTNTYPSLEHNQSMMPTIELGLVSTYSLAQDHQLLIKKQKSFIGLTTTCLQKHSYHNVQNIQTGIIHQAFYRKPKRGKGTNITQGEFP